MLKLKLQYFSHLMWRTDSFEKLLMLGKIEGGRRRDERGWDRWMASPTQWTWVYVGSGSWWWTGRPGVVQFWFHKESDMSEQLNWPELKNEKDIIIAEIWNVIKYYENMIKNCLISGTSVVVQWLRLCAPNAGGPGLIPGWGARSCMLQLRVHMLQSRPSAAK